jgi:hypothetical protein
VSSLGLRSHPGHGLSLLFLLLLLSLIYLLLDDLLVVMLILLIVCEIDLVALFRLLNNVKIDFNTSTLNFFAIHF